jgi:hypothetical protein
LGPTGSGKTYTALEIALGLAELDEIGVIDTEHKSSEKYVDIFGEFAAIHLDTFDPRVYIEAIELFVRSGYKVIIVDSLTHAWAGKGGALELKDRATQRNGGNSYTAWAAVTPLQNQLIETIIGAPAHIIATMRSKMDHVQEVNERGRTVVRKVGMAPVQRDGVEYEFDVVAELDIDNVMSVTKTRNPAFKDLQLVRPTREFGRRLRSWLEVVTPQDRTNVVALPDRSAENWSAPSAETAGSLPPLPRDPVDRGGSGERTADADDAFAEGMADADADDERDAVWWPMPEANAFACQAVGCNVTYRSHEELFFGGRRFRGRQLAERTIADSTKPLCAPHGKAWNGGTDVLSEAVSA